MLTNACGKKKRGRSSDLEKKPAFEELIEYNENNSDAQFILSDSVKRMEEKMNDMCFSFR